MPHLSFIIPIYNLKEEEVQSCISSVANQTADKCTYEIIIVDDGSNNGVEKCCDIIGKQYGATVIHQKNQGLAVARNSGMKSARGEWIVHVDGDDWIDHELAESLIEKSKHTNADIIVWGYVLKNGSKIQKLLLKNKSAFDAPYSQLRELILCYILDFDRTFTALALNTSWGKAYRRDFIEKNYMYYDSSLRRAQDAVYNLYAFNKASAVDYIDKALNYYRTDNISLSRGFNPKTFDYLSLTAQAVNKFVSSNNVSSKVNVASAVFIQRCFRMINVQYYQHKDNKQPYRVRKKLFMDGFETEPFKSAFACHVKRPGLYNKITDFLYSHRMFAGILFFNTLIHIISKLKRII